MTKQMKAIIKRPDFDVDNFLHRNSSKIFGTQRRALESGQIPLPGYAPLTPFDQWVTWGLYYLLNPGNPTAPKMIRITDLIKILEFSRGQSGYPSDTYQMVWESLHRLRSFPIPLSDVYEKGKGKNRKRFRMESNDPIITHLAYIYREGVTSPESRRDKSKVKNVNTVAFTPTGETPPPIWAIEDETPIGVRFTINPQFLLGLTKIGDNIGFTRNPKKYFALRPIFQPKPIANRLLNWVLSQTDRTMPKRYLDNLSDTLNLSESQRKRNRDALIQGFDMLKTSKVIDDYTIGEDDRGQYVVFAKSDDWHFSRGKAAPALPEAKGD